MKLMIMQVTFLLILSTSLVFAAKIKRSKRPNIIFILADDLGWNDVSFHGSLQIPTPNIDTLAANSVVLNNYYVQPLCTPSRASLMTGIHPIRYGLQYNVLQSPFPSGLDLNIKLLPEYLQDKGYRTHMIGKWHLGFYKDVYSPTFRGFQSHLGYWTGKMDYYNHTDYDVFKNTSLPYGWGRVLRRNMEYADYLEGKYATTIFTEEAEKLIRKHDTSKPMFLYLAHLAVHSANEFELYQAPKKYVDMAPHIDDMTRRTLAGMAIALDESIGKVFKALKKKKMLDNTIFIVSTDNGGEAAGYRGGVGSNWPLRGNKGTTWEGGVRGTAFIWSPLIKKSPRISKQLMSIHDWLPTLYSAAGGKVDDLDDIYGHNLWDAIVNDKPSPRTELLHNIDPIENVQTVRRNEYKLVIENYLENLYDSWFGPTGRDNGISEADYRRRLKKCEVRNILKARKNYCEVSKQWLAQLNINCNPKNNTQKCTSAESPCLFNIIEDPCEETNIADQNPEIVQELLALIQAYNSTAVPLVNRTVDPRADPRLYDDHWTNWGDFISRRSLDYWGEFI